jgi:triacylglycerol lipase
VLIFIQGTYLGTLQGVSHLNLVGWINPAQYKWAEMMGREITFRPATFYLGVADMLAGEVEGQPPAEKGTGNEAGRGVDLTEDSRGVDEPASSAQQQHRTSGAAEPLQRTNDGTPQER